MDNFNDIKIGDSVINVAGYSVEKRLITIDKVTPKQFGSKGIMFWKKDGTRVGGDIWSSSYCIKATEEEIKAIKESQLRKNLINWVRNNCYEFSTETLKELYEKNKK